MFLHLPEGSLGAGLLVPRVTDDVWPLLWSQHFSSESPPLPGGIPIGGRIEFDLDLSVARWYNAWARSYGQIPVGLGGRDPHLAHRGMADGFDNSESLHAPRSEVAGLSQPARPKHIRQLSLLDRRPSARTVPFPISTTRRDTSSTRQEVPTDAVSVSQTIIRDPRDEVESMVNKWRANTPTMVSGARAPNTFVASPEPSPRDLLDLDEFAWSISSAGPLSYDPYEEPLLPSAVQSMHIADRAAGSVILTPTTATSYGPPRSGFSHEGSLVSNASRYPSPDIAARMIFEAPLTPSTATSWGPPSDDGFDYYQMHDQSRYPSPDIALRMLEDSPPTPSTATTWGPPDDEFDYASLNDINVVNRGDRTPDLGERVFTPSMPTMTFPRDQTSCPASSL